MFAWYALGRKWPRNSGSLSEPMLCDFPGIVNEGFTILGIIYFCENTCWSSDLN